MFSFLKSKSPTKEEQTKQSWSTRLKNGLQRTRHKLSNQLTQLVLGKKTIDDDLFEELETLLLSADIGVEATQKILDHLTEAVNRKELTNPETLMSALKEILISILEPYQQPLEVNTAPFIILMVGVNGVGKTTSIAKLAHFYQQQGKKVMLAAGDTFRAAATEQLQVWGERNNAAVIAQRSGADSASVIYDAVQAANARNYDVLIADTAGRLHTQDHLMEELKKIKRVITKINPEAPQETMLIIDAGTGQNALNQAQQFHDAIGLTSLTLTKLDGTAKGGIVFNMAEKMKLPIRFIGIGEQIEDLKPFDATAFVDALFAVDPTDE